MFIITGHDALAYLSGISAIWNLGQCPVKFAWP